jgi:hypothetical protein
MPNQRNKNVHRYRAMVKFGRDIKNGDKFTQRELQYYMNNYIGVSGRRHKQTTVSKIQLTSLLRMHPNFRYWPAERKTATGEWSYIETEDEIIRGVIK